MIQGGAARSARRIVRHGHHGPHIHAICSMASRSALSSEPCGHFHLLKCVAWSDATFLGVCYSFCTGEAKQSCRLLIASYELSTRQAPYVCMLTPAQKNALGLQVGPERYHGKALHSSGKPEES